MFAAFLLLAILAVVTVFSIMLGKRQQAGQNQTVEAPLPVDPFAGMTYDDDDLKQKVMTGGSSLADFESEAELWLRARDTYAEAQKLIDESSVKRAAADASWRDLSARAKELVEEAVQRAEVWRGVLVKDSGEDSNEVARMDKTLQKWRRTQTILHKTVSR